MSFGSCNFLPHLQCRSYTSNFSGPWRKPSGHCWESRRYGACCPRRCGRPVLPPHAMVKTIRVGETSPPDHRPLQKESVESGIHPPMSFAPARWVLLEALFGCALVKEWYVIQKHGSTGKSRKQRDVRLQSPGPAWGPRRSLPHTWMMVWAHICI